VTDGGLRVLVGVFWGFMLRCGGRYEGDFGGETLEVAIEKEAVWGATFSRPKLTKSSKNQSMKVYTYMTKYLDQGYRL
jgi:hypothetical protein